MSEAGGWVVGGGGCVGAAGGALTLGWCWRPPHSLWCEPVGGAGGHAAMKILGNTELKKQ